MTITKEQAAFHSEDLVVLAGFLEKDIDSFPSGSLYLIEALIGNLTQSLSDICSDIKLKYFELDDILHIVSEELRTREGK